MVSLTTPLDKIKGVGPKTSQQLAAAGLHTVDDLIHFLPRKHEDFSQVTDEQVRELLAAARRDEPAG